MLNLKFNPYDTEGTEIEILKNNNDELLYYNNFEMPLIEFAEELYNVINKNCSYTFEFHNNENCDEYEVKGDVFQYNYETIFIYFNGEEIFSYHYDFSGIEELKESVTYLFDILEINYEIL